VRWVLLWVVLVLAAGAVFALLGRSLWRKAKALTAELTEASDRMSAVAASISDLTQHAGGDDTWAAYERPTVVPPAGDRRPPRS
jgi:hypothetical protein